MSIEDNVKELGLRELGPIEGAKLFLPTPQEAYETAWNLIGNLYYSLDALKHWADWKHKFDGKLNNMADLEQALSEMAASLGDQWTFYKSASTTSEELLNSNSPVAGQLLEGNLAYIAVSDFISPALIDHFTGVLVDLYNQAAGQLNGLILDLRFNPGGYADVAINLASLIVKDGTIVTREERQGLVVNSRIMRVIPVPPHMLAEQPDGDPVRQILQVLKKKPMVVLVNGSSASGSELLAGALKDNRRATIIGTTTFGKGVGCERFHIEGAGTLQVSTMRYLTPSGFCPLHKGIEPDIIVEQTAGADDQLITAFNLLQSQVTPEK